MSKQNIANRKLSFILIKKIKRKNNKESKNIIQTLHKHLNFKRIIFFYFFIHSGSLKMPKIQDTTCEACGTVEKNPKGHALRAHMPWYMDPATTCVDCQISEGRGSEFGRFHAMHQHLVGGPLIQAWFFLMNGVFWSLTEGLGLGTLNNLLRFVVDKKLYPSSFTFSAEELFFFREFDRRFGLEPLSTES